MTYALVAFVQEVAPRRVVVGHAAVDDQIVVPAGHGEWVVLDRAQPAEDLEDAVGPPSTERAGASRWCATRKRRAASAVTFI
jgi:hypothetical protein